MEMKVFCFLAILGIACALNIPAGGSHKSKRDVEITEEFTKKLSVNLESSDHTSLLDLGPFGNAKEVLSKANFSEVHEIAELSPLTSIEQLPPLPDLRASIEHARFRVATILGAADGDLRTAIHGAIVEALRAVDVVKSISELVFTILSNYFNMAQNAVFGIATKSILEEGVLLATSSVQVVTQAVVVA